MPAAGWVNNSDPAKDVKLNILRKHDDRFLGNTAFINASLTRGYSPAGLEAQSAIHPFLCASCHGSNALSMASLPNVPPLTTSMHGMHATVIDPGTGASLESATTRESCYHCHPGPVTQCLRGAMSNVATGTGTNAVECQSCHGPMSSVGDPARQGWFNEPACQECHTGTATANSGQIAYHLCVHLPARRCVSPPTRHLPLTRTRRRQGFRSTASPAAMAACSAKPATAPRMPNSPHRSSTTTSRAPPCKGMSECWSSALPATVRFQTQSTAGRTDCTPSAPPGSAPTRTRRTVTRRTASPAMGLTTGGRSCRKHKPTARWPGNRSRAARLSDAIAVTTGRMEGRRENTGAGAGPPHSCGGAP